MADASTELKLACSVSREGDVCVATDDGLNGIASQNYHPIVEQQITHPSPVNVNLIDPH